ncbi:ParB/RepB/Spo0J family partition protein (plasmid) [Piscirickettsia salmonis]|uniref:ParB/RepB/Spo0J family partition protein n=1 Tax=Piscirickettsia salmonis TaxID=1238 RepID=UPI0012B6B4B9|nr:ParB/RepB/Spo0J family partition protein [Piscirickettsia salmonis]QGP52226.1 ParB/RepB/Spo0J family partition protein [Piscirickettsia salmonis]QGP57348.1 ParB/RepB/Spo0J family partition protein [Piscirickettsia salmonis]QGP66942.1 ParB/RepB/Spo0J family partition protein [Piscirickettsia salmonis]
MKLSQKSRKRNRHKSIADYEKSYVSEYSDQWVNTNKITIASIKIDRKNKDSLYITDLAKSMAGKKQVNAAIVREMGDGSYELINGECRYDAAKINKEPLLVRVVDYNDEEAVNAIIAENDKRQDLCDYDKALAYIEYKERFNISSSRKFAARFNISKTQAIRLFSVERIDQSVRDVLPMKELRAKQFEAISSRIGNNEEYIEAFICTKQKLTPEGSLDWQDFLSRVDHKVNPPEKQPQKKIERYVFSSEKANLRYTDSGFIVKSDKLTRKQKEQIQEALDAIL